MQAFENNQIIKSLTISSNIHKQVRHHLIPYLKPGIKLLDIAKIIESKTIELSKGYDTINRGIGFPASLALNNCAAHFHPKSNNNIAFLYNDVLKIDFGIETNGWITDSAFTFSFNPKYNELLDAVKECVYVGIKNAGIDVNINEWGEIIEEVMESHELHYNGNSYPVKVIKNLTGHNILRNIIHGGIKLPPYKSNQNLGKFKEGIYAIEPFGVVSFDKNLINYDKVVETGESTLYRLNPSYINDIPKINNNRINYIYNNFNTLPFTDRYLPWDTINLDKNIILSYPPLCVPKNCYTAQFEHTIYIGDNKKIIFSQGNDY